MAVFIVLCLMGQASVPVGMWHIDNMSMNKKYYNIGCEMIDLLGGCGRGRPIE